jgi:class 3 adenylate cyclase
LSSARDPRPGFPNYTSAVRDESERAPGTVTLLFTDIEGSTRLLNALGDRFGEALAEHRRLLRDVWQRHDGVEIDTQGDAFFVVFSRASDAPAAGADTQRALAAHPWPDGRPVRVRIGVHTGAPSPGPEGYVGLDVHRAARIAAEMVEAVVGNRDWSAVSGGLD